ncbi:MAG: hypothetical protein ABJC04_04135, partial [Verrucomicrobiota bacterium]
AADFCLCIGVVVKNWAFSIVNIIKLRAVVGAWAILVSGCAPSHSDKPYSFTELVMFPGDTITAETPTGTITIKADDELSRTYTWEGSSRSAKLWPRKERWYGSLGAYYPGPGEHWRKNHSITRGVLEEGQQHFESLDAALEWIGKPWHQSVAIYRDDGLFVLFGKIPQRYQINVDVFQIFIKDQKPKSLPGSQNNKIHFSQSRQNVPLREN